MLRDLGHQVSASAVAELYEDVIDVFILDETDERITGDVQALGMRVFSTDTVMNTLDVKQQLARSVLDLLAPVENIGVSESGAILK